MIGSAVPEWVYRWALSVRDRRGLQVRRQGIVYHGHSTKWVFGHLPVTYDTSPGETRLLSLRIPDGSLEPLVYVAHSTILDNNRA